MLADHREPGLVPAADVGVQGQRAARPAAGVGKQRAGTRHVEDAVRVGALAVPEEVGADHAVGDEVLPVVDGVDDGLAVDSQGQRLADPAVGELRPVQRHPQVAEAVAGLLEHVPGEGGPGP